MSEKLEKFYNERRCVKCGAGGLSSWEQPAAEYVNADGYECIKRTCPRCGYVWYEEPLDA